MVGVKKGELNMNYQYFQSQILKIIRSQLNGDYSDSMTRFSYIKGGANKFLQLIRDPNYLGYDREMILFNKIIPRINRKIKPINRLIDLGPGDGTKAIKIIKLLCTQNLDYLAFDISCEMLNITKHIFDKNNLEGKFKICDWHNPIYLKGAMDLNITCGNLVLLLGNTLTNEINIQKFLTNLRKVLAFLSNSNYLLIGLEVFDGNIDKIIKEYKNEINYDLTIKPLEMVGISKNDGKVDIIYDKKMERIEEWFISTGEKNIKFNDSSITFHEGNRILLSVTYKPSVKKIRKIFVKSGWNILFSDFEKNQGMFLLQSMSKNHDVEMI